MEAIDLHAKEEKMTFKFVRTLTRNCYGSWQCNIPKAVAENLLRGSTSRKVLLTARGGIVSLQAIDDETQEEITQ
jgi:hypothetical protein